jgi:hypothetical protein
VTLELKDELYFASARQQRDLAHCYHILVREIVILTPTEIARKPLAKAAAIKVLQAREVELNFKYSKGK